jgi:hypothetical protein
MTIWCMRSTCWITKAINRHSEHAMLIAFHGNNGYANAPHCYVIPTFPAFFNSGMSTTEHRTPYGEKLHNKKTPCIIHTLLCTARANPALTWHSVLKPYLSRSPGLWWRFRFILTLLVSVTVLWRAKGFTATILRHYLSLRSCRHFSQRFPQSLAESHMEQRS